MENQKGLSKNMIIIIIAVVVILLIIIGAIVMGGKKAQPNPNPTPNPTPNPNPTPTAKGNALDVIADDSSTSEADDSVSLSDGAVPSTPSS
jgi:flagellar basal body-associated protein FliL